MEDLSDGSHGVSGTLGPWTKTRPTPARPRKVRVVGSNSVAAKIGPYLYPVCGQEAPGLQFRSEADPPQHGHWPGDPTSAEDHSHTDHVLALSHSRCGKPSCHCADGQGHPAWSLTFMRDGQKHVERVPADWVDSVRQRVEQARQFKEAVAEIFTANAQLLALQRDQSRAVAKRQKTRR